MGSFDLHGEWIGYRFEKKGSLKNIRLSFLSPDEVRIAAPHMLTDREIQTFLARHANWLTKHRDRLRKKVDQVPHYRFATGERFLYLGQEVTLWIQHMESKSNRPPPLPRKSRVLLQETGLSPIPLLCLVWPEGQAPESHVVRTLLRRWYKEEARRILLQRLDYFQTLYPFPYNQVRFKDQKTRWGSCSSRRNLNFNWRLVMAPLPVLDYVVAHELCHLKELNHSPAFWRLMARHMPDYQERKRWLRENGPLLMW